MNERLAAQAHVGARFAVRTIHFHWFFGRRQSARIEPVERIVTRVATSRKKETPAISSIAGVRSVSESVRLTQACAAKTRTCRFNPTGVSAGSKRPCPVKVHEPLPAKNGSCRHGPEATRLQAPWGTGFYTDKNSGDEEKRFSATAVFSGQRDGGRSITTAAPRSTKERWDGKKSRTNFGAPPSEIGS